MAYRSRFHDRRQSILLGNIRSTDSYDMFYDMVRMAVRDRVLPVSKIGEGELVVRKSSYGIEDSRTIPPRADTNLDKRFSGLRPDGTRGHGALYLGSVSGVLREHVHYANASSGSLWMPGSADTTRALIAAHTAGARLKPGEKLHLYRAADKVLTADLRLDSLFRFFARYQFDIADKVPLDLLVNAVASSCDYSASRGMADAIYDSRQHSGVSGLMATSARADSDSGLILGSHGDSKGSNVIALLGAPESVAGVLKPVETFESFSDLMAALPGLKKG